MRDNNKNIMVTNTKERMKGDDVFSAPCTNGIFVGTFVEDSALIGQFKVTAPHYDPICSQR